MNLMLCQISLFTCKEKWHPSIFMYCRLKQYWKRFVIQPVSFQGPFDAVRKLLSRGESSKMDVNEKSDMFFCDYSLMPLFVQENYLSVDPGQAR